MKNKNVLRKKYLFNLKKFFNFLGKLKHENFFIVVFELKKFF